MEQTNVNSPSGRIKSDKVSRGGMPLPEAGRIKIGEKRLNAAGKEYPSSIDYFRATGTFAQHFHSVFGQKPDKLTIVFISDNVADSCNEEYACWENGKRWGYGDGEKFTAWNSAKKEYEHCDKDSPLLKGKKWDIMLTLRFVIPELKGVLGHWVFTTKGAKTTIPSIVKSFDFIKETVGTVRGVPFELVVEKAKGYSPGEAKQYSKVKLIPCFSEQYMVKVRDFLAQGKSLTELAPLMVSEARLLSNSTRESELATIEAEVVTEKAPLEVDYNNVKEKTSGSTTLFNDEGELQS